MSSPIGHALAGLIFYTFAHRSGMLPRASWRFAFLFIVLAGLPDFDMFLVWFLDFPREGTHRYLTHSIAFAAGAGLLLGWLFQRLTRHPNRHLYWLFPLAILSHNVMDLTCIDLLPPEGIQLLWPFSMDFVYYPLPFMRSLGTYVIAGDPRWLAFIKAGTLELLIFGGIYLLMVLFYPPQAKRLPHPNEQSHSAPAKNV